MKGDNIESRKIIAVNFHAVIDEIYEIEDFEVDGTFRCEPPRQTPAGKGVNVAYALAGLGLQPHLVLIAGEKEIPMYREALESRGVMLHAIPVAVPTRRHITISDPKRQTTTHLQASGDAYPQEALAAASSCVEELLEPGAILILSGSLPACAPHDSYANLIQAAREHEALSVLDTSGKPLEMGIVARPDVIKPNRYEAEVLLGRRLSDIASQAEAAAALHERGISYVMLSDGANGVVLVCREGTWHGTIPLAEVAAVNTQGCGDSVIAGFVDGLSRGVAPSETLRHAVACGTANATVQGAGWIRAEDVERLEPKVEIRPL